MKYIDAEKLIAEIEKTRREFINKGEQNLHDAEIIRRSVISSCNDFLTLITSLQQEQPNADLENAAQHVYESWNGGTMDDVRRDMAELGKVLNARKEE